MDEAAETLGAFARLVGLDPASATLREALTHASYAAEHESPSNERLEFLGDAVVDLAVAHYIVATYPDFNEGHASVLRSHVVNEAVLAAAARDIGIAAVLKVGRGVLKEQGLERSSILADAFEAVVAALYLEQGFGPAKAFVESVLAVRIEEAAQNGSTLDPKTRLRQWAQLQGYDTPVYQVEAQGPSHDMVFVASVRVGEILACGSGTSKKRAEAAAAVAAWEESNA